MRGWCQHGHQPLPHPPIVAPELFGCGCAIREALASSLNGSYADFIEKGARFRARVNHVEQAFQPLALYSDPLLRSVLPPRSCLD